MPSYRTRTGRHSGVVGAAALVAGLLVPLTAGPAGAADTVELVVAGDANSDGILDVSVRSATGEVLRTLYAGDDFSFVDNVTTSPDGQRVAYVVSRIGDAAADEADELVVQDISGRGSRVVARHVSNGTVFTQIGRPSFSPDGASIAYPLFTDPTVGSVSYTVRRAAVASGATSLVAGSSGADSVAWTSPTEMLVVHVTNGLSRLPVSGAVSPLARVAGVAGDEGDVVASPVPGQIALIRYSGVNGFLETARYDAGVLSSRVTVSSGGDDYSPSFSRDGGTVFFSRCTDCIPGSDVWSTPSAGPASDAAVVFTTTGQPEMAVAVASRDDVAPGAMTLGSATLNGTSASIRIAPVRMPDLSGVLVTRSLGGVAGPETYRAVVGGAFTDTGLVVGKTYSYTVRPIDRSGNTGPQSGRKLLTALNLPALTFADPTSRTVTTARFPLRLVGPGNPASTRYDVTYAKRPSTTYASWLVKTTSTVKVFGEASRPVAVAPGTTWTFRGVAFDVYGNSTPVRTSGKAVVPYDQSRASFTTGVPATSAVAAGKYLGTTRTLRAAGQRATLPTLTGDRFQVVGERGTTGGTFDVYRGTTRVATKVSTYSTSRIARSVLWTSPVGTTAASYSVRWVPSGIAGRTNVVLDGFAVRG